MALAENLHARREALGLTLEAVASELGVNRSTILRFESGATKRIPIETIERLAAILKTSTAALIGVQAGEEGSAPHGDTRFRLLTRTWTSLPPDKQELLLKIAATMSQIADEEHEK